jgi:hypothetical protein
MPRQTEVRNYFTFVKGMNTEASGLTFPESTSSDEQNFDLFINGSRKRRKGCDYEDSYVLSSNISADYVSDRAVAAHRWTAVGGRGSTNFAVVQIGPTLYFHDLNQASFSSNTKSFTVDLSSFAAASEVSPGSEPVRTVSGKGLLFVVGKGIDPFYIKYNSTTDTIETTSVNIQVRDFKRQEDGVAFDDRPTYAELQVLGTYYEHYYNLLNQGWSATNIATYLSSKSVYPSNADVWYLGKNSSDDFSPSKLDKQGFGNTAAGNGHFIVDAFDKVREGLANETTYERPQCVAFMAGRAFYGGVEDTGYSNRIYYTQIMENEEQAGYCYQSADPTSEFSNALVSTDGGVIVIPEMGRLMAMQTVQNSLVLLADNGVWVVSGSTGSGFFADDYVVEKITSSGIVGADTVVSVEGTIMYWGYGGIYVLSQDQISGKLTAKNTTQSSIQTFYNAIPEASKIYAKGVYDLEQKKVYWAYNGDTAFEGGTYKNKYNKVLVLHTQLAAFYPYEISELASDSPFISAPIITLKLRRSTTTANVVVNGDPVEADSVQVTADLASYSTGLSQLKFVALEPQSDGINYKYTFAEFNNNSFLDWEDSDLVGVDAPAYLETGYEIYADAVRTKDTPYIWFMFQKTETGFVDDGSGNIILENPSGCLVASRWDWSNSSASGKWGTQFQAYRFKRSYTPSGAGDTFDDGVSIVQTKNRLRGTGRAIQLRIDTEAGKDCHMLGWSMLASVQQVP